MGAHPGANENDAGHCLRVPPFPRSAQKHGSGQGRGVIVDKRIAVGPRHQRAIKKNQPVGRCSSCIRGCDPAEVGALDCATIEDGGRIPENKIAVPRDETVAEILARHFVDHQRVLIAEKPDIIEDDAVGGGSHRQRRRHISVRDRIFKRYVPRHERGGAILNFDHLTVTKRVNTSGENDRRRIG